MSTTLDLPIIVCGELRYPDGDDIVVLKYEGDTNVHLPRLAGEDVERIVANRESLHDVPLAQVTGYLSAAGLRWVDPHDPLRREAVENAAATTGYSQTTVERDYNTIGDYLMFRNNYYDMLDAELGDHHVMDEWVRNQVALVRAFPRGRALHVMVGNVPLASIGSMMRSILTRNHTVVKLPARDPVSSLYFARALIEANGADHPISRSLSVGYWDYDADAFDVLLDASDVVCAWGRGSSLQAIKARVPHSVPYVEFGPKRSFAVLYVDDVDLEQAALRIAHDVSVYDQEACFSPQHIFVIGDPGLLLAPLARRLEEQARLFPPARRTPDVASHVMRTRLEARFRGWSVDEGGERWTIVVADNPCSPVEHPLSRTIFVHPVSSLADILPMVDDETQTVTVLPYHRALEVAEALCPRGAARVCDGGLVAHPRQGFTHDGGYPLQQFVRLAHVDAPMDYVYKYGPPTALHALERTILGSTATQNAIAD
jgi:long-chain-fatty-acyl-CoA reductase